MAYSWPMSLTNAKQGLGMLVEKALSISKDPVALEKAKARYLKDLKSIRFAFLKLDIYPKFVLGTRVEESDAYPFSVFFSGR